tara:strand:+ start:8826 stop:10985 length:2160 start_codon:yes stop_codon:yes gene_type:complete
MVKYASEEHRKEAIREQKRASAKRIRDAKKAEGEGIVENVKDYIGNKVAKWKQIITGRITQFSPKNQRLIKKYGGQKIVGFVVHRTPVSGLLTGALSFFSAGKFGENKKANDFDDLFHLFLECKLADGTRFTIEKNERIGITINAPIRPKTESEVINNFPPDLTIDEMIIKTQDAMGNRFHSYSAKDNNCQDFIIAILNANKIGNATNRTFIKQDTKALFKDLTYLRKFSNTLTDIGARANVAIEGGMINEDGFNTPPNEQFIPLRAGDLSRIVDIVRRDLNADNFYIFRMIRDRNPDIFHLLEPELNIAFAPPVVNEILHRYTMFSNFVPVVSPPGTPPHQPQHQGQYTYADQVEGDGLVISKGKKPTKKERENQIFIEEGRKIIQELPKGLLNTLVKSATKVKATPKNTRGKGLGKENITLSLQEKGGVDFDDIKWGTFTQQFKRFKEEHKNSPIKDLEDFAEMIVKNKEDYQKKTLKRARFYLNVLTKKNNISGNSINMSGSGMYAGKGMYAGDGIMAGQGGCPDCPMCGNGLYAGEGIEEISHPILDEINGGSIWGDAGRWFKKAGRTINKAVVKPAVKWTKKATKDVDRAFSKGGVMEKVGKTAFREGVPVLTGALAGGIGALAGPGSSMALGYAGGKGGEELVKMSGIGHRGTKMLKHTGYAGDADKFGQGFTAGQGITAGQGATKRKGRFVKGSQEAKDFMASLRAKRMGKN